MKSFANGSSKRPAQTTGGLKHGGKNFGGVRGTKKPKSPVDDYTTKRMIKDIQCGAKGKMKGGY